MSWTIDRRRRISRLKRADLPTFGRPATTTRKMFVMGNGARGPGSIRSPRPPHSPFEQELEPRMGERVDVRESREDPAPEDLLTLVEDRDPGRGILGLDAVGGQHTAAHREGRQKNV